MSPAAGGQPGPARLNGSGPTRDRDGHGDAELLARARRFAQRPADRQSEVGTEVMLFRLGGETYAVESRLLNAVHSVDAMASIPCTPPHIAGVVNVRGEILTVVDLAEVLGVARGSVGGRQLLLLERGGARVGLLVDSVEGTRYLPREGLDGPLGDQGFAAAIAEAKIVLLDLERLLEAGRLEVAEDPS